MKLRANKWSNLPKATQQSIGSPEARTQIRLTRALGSLRNQGQCIVKHDCMTGLVCYTSTKSPHGADLTCMSALFQASWTPHTSTHNFFQEDFWLSVTGCHLGHYHVRVRWDHNCLSFPTQYCRKFPRSPKSLQDPVEETFWDSPAKGRRQSIAPPRMWPGVRKEKVLFQKEKRFGHKIPIEIKVLWHW